MRLPVRLPSLLAAAGALLAAASVALAAYAAHATTGDAQGRLQTAAVFAFGHGLALVVLAPVAARRREALALAMLCGGVLLFAGSLAGAVLAGVSTAVAPAGGLLMIAGWLLLAVDRLLAGRG